MPEANTLPVGNLVAIGFLLVTLVYIVYYLVLRYHWNAYTSDEKVSRLTMLLFTVSTAPLLIIMGIITLTFLY